MNTNKLLDTSALVEVKQYIDEIKEAVETGSGIQVIEGTADAPIIASELELGVYVISGIVQSSTTNTTSTEIVKRVYSIRRDSSTTILWEENPTEKTINYIVFYHEGDVAPVASNIVVADNTALEGKADKATTLAGYSITDAYTKAEIDGKNYLTEVPSEYITTTELNTALEGYIGTDSVIDGGTF